MSNVASVVLIHGHGVDSSIWNDIYDELASNYSVLKPDFSRLTSHTTIEAYTEELNARLQSASIDNVILVGHSMGGYIALAFADRSPDRVSGLVLYHSTAYADNDERKAQRQQLIATMRAEGGAQFIEKQVPKMVSSAYSDEKKQVLADRFRDLPTDALIAGMEAIAGRPDRTHVLRNATFPVLLVLGKDDQLIPVDKTQELATLSDEIDVALIDQAGHLSMIEQPESSVTTLTNFISQL